MHYLKVTALATALAALASTSPLPDNAIVRRHRAVIEGADPLDSDTVYKEKRDRVVVEGADPLDSDIEVYRKEKRHRAVVEGADPLDSDIEVYRKEKRHRAVVKGADPLDADTAYRKEKRGTYAKYENNGPYVPMSDEMEA